MKKESDLKLALETTFGEKDSQEEIGCLKLPVTTKELNEFTKQLKNWYSCQNTQ